MTIKEYITEKFIQYGISLSEADWTDISFKIGLNDEVNEENLVEVYKLLAINMIPQLLLRPKSVSENGFSIAHDTDGLLKYYAMLCANLGIDDNLNSKSVVSDATDMW